MEDIKRMYEQKISTYEKLISELETTLQTAVQLLEYYRKQREKLDPDYQVHNEQ